QPLDRDIAPTQHAERAVQRHQCVVQQYGDRVGRRGGHAGQAPPAAAGSASIGSESEPPGGIIGNTLASCSIMNSTSAGPGSAFARPTASASSPATFTR